MGENLSRQIVFDCTSALTDRPNANIVCVIQRTGDKQPYAAQMTRVGDTNNYKLVLTSTEVAKSGSVRFELRMVDGEEILKAAIYTGTVEASMSGIGDTPGEPIPDALNRLETAISEVGKYADLKEAVETLQTSGTSTAEAAADAKNAADANAASIHGAGAAYDNTKGTIAARLEALEAGGGTSSTKIANGTGMAQVGTGKELVVDYSATGFTSAPAVVASHCQTGGSDTDTSGIVKVLSVTKTGCKISIIGGTTDHDYPVSWIATGT